MKICEKCYHEKSDDVFCPHCHNLDWYQAIYPLFTLIILAGFLYIAFTQF